MHTENFFRLFQRGKSPFVGAFLFAFLLNAPGAFAADQPPPQGASSDVLEKKLREEAQQKLFQEKPVPQPDIKEEKPPEKTAAPAVSFYVKKIRLQGNEVLPAEEIEPVLQPFEGREINSTDINRLKENLENLFRKHGYLAVAYTPAQELNNQELVIGIVTSRMGRLHVENLRYSSAWKLKSYWKIPEGRIIQYQEIQRSINSMNQNPDRLVQSVLRPGEKAGHTDIYLKAQERFPVHPGFSWDNQGVKATGKHRYGFTVRHNNFLRLDDTFLIGTSFGQAFGALYISHVIPITDFGTSFVWGFSYANVSPRKEFKQFSINAVSQTYSLALHQKVISKERFSANVHTGLDFKEKLNHQLGTYNIWDRLRVLSVGGDVQAYDKTGRWNASQDLFLSLSPRGDGNPLNSRGAEQSFFKYGFSLQRIQILPFATQGILSLSGQLTPSKLPSLEQFYLGGAMTVRGYPESDYGADQGILARAEYNTPFFIAPAEWKLPKFNETLRNQIKLITFFDYGYGQLRDPSADFNERRDRILNGTGAGFAIRLSQYISLRCEWAVGLRDALTEGGRSQFHFRLSADV